jgi:hypothetical protein
MRSLVSRVHNSLDVVTISAARRRRPARCSPASNAARLG